MKPASQVPDPQRREEVTVSPLTVPALFGGLVIGFGSGYLIGPWAGVIVLVLLIGLVLVAARHRDHVEAAVAGVLGLVLGFGGVMALVLLHTLG